MTIRMMALASAFALATFAVPPPGGARAAGCPFKNDVPIKLLAAGFEAWKSVSGQMAECGDFSAELDQEFANKQPAAFAASPALYQIGGVSIDSIVALLDAGTIRPLDDLIAKFGKDLPPNELIKLNGKTYVIAFQVNDQTLMYRKDIFDKLGLTPPKTYEELLAVAAKLKQSGATPYPMGATWKAGWNLGEDFVNLYLGYGGTLFQADNRPAVKSEAGVKTLEMMKQLMAFMNPNVLTDDSTAVQQQFQQGQIAMANLWASRGGAMDDAKESKVVGKVVSAPTPAAMPGGKPATTVWWDGMAIATHATDQQAEAAFKLILWGLNPAMVAQHNDDSVWLIPGYKPGPIAKGAIEAMQMGAPAYPVATRMGLIHSAIGNNIADYLAGRAGADATLAKVEAAYVTSAKEAGLIK
jgi:ABC-type glycerol-3-phosphate transport system substrate-binding protein